MPPAGGILVYAQGDFVPTLFLSLDIMISGAPREARWIVAEPRRSLPLATVHRLVHKALGPCWIGQIHTLTGGFRNLNIRVQVENEWVVVRVYEHDPSLCRKEVDLLRLVGGSVPVPPVIHAEPHGFDDLPPFLLMKYVEGTSFHELKRSEDRQAVAQAAFSIGETLASIGRIAFAKPGWLAPGPTVTAPLLEGVDPFPRFVDLCLASPRLNTRMPRQLRQRTSDLVWSRAPQLGNLDGQTRLVHGDFGNRNLLVRCCDRGWSVAAVLDWEFAVSGSPLADIGHFLRYEPSSHGAREPHFSRGYLSAGGILPPDWRRLARLIDLAALCESLTHEHLPDLVIAELLELVLATVEDRDPALP